MSLNPCFQVGLDVAGRPGLIIGGGREAEAQGGDSSAKNGKSG